MRMRRLQMLLDHAYARSRLSYIDAEMDAAGRERVKRHAHECAECGATLRALRHIGVALRDLGRPPLPRRPVRAAAPTGRDGDVDAGPRPRPISPDPMRPVIIVAAPGDGSGRQDCEALAHVPDRTPARRGAA